MLAVLLLTVFLMMTIPRLNFPVYAQASCPSSYTTPGMLYDCSFSIPCPNPYPYLCTNFLTKTVTVPYAGTYAFYMDFTVTSQGGTLGLMTYANYEAYEQDTPWYTIGEQLGPCLSPCGPDTTGVETTSLTAGEVLYLVVDYTSQWTGAYCYSAPCYAEGTFALDMQYVSATALSCSPTSFLVGTSTTCTATVTGWGPTGTVTFTQSGSGSVSPSSSTCTINAPNSATGACQVTLTGSGAGSDTVTATYGGDYTDVGSWATQDLVVGAPPLTSTTTTVSCVPATISVGSASTCTASVSGSSPTGTITFSQSGTGSVTFSSSTCTLSSGSCYVTATGATTGSVTIAASYGGDSNNYGSQGSGSITVTAVQLTTPTLTMQSSAASVTVGQTVTLSGTITPSTSGTVTLYESVGGSAFVVLNVATLTNGAYSYTFSPSTVGSYQFYATWSGNSQFNPATSPTISVSVLPVAIQTTNQTTSPCAPYYIGSSTCTTPTTPASSTTSSKAIPEFPAQLGFALLVAVVIVASYIVARRMTLPRTGSRIGPSGS